MWKFIDPVGVNPEMFDLVQVVACKVKKYSGTEDVMGIRMNGWQLFADLFEICPVTGTSLQESTWYLFAAKGLA